MQVRRHNHGIDTKVFSQTILILFLVIITLLLPIQCVETLRPATSENRLRSGALRALTGNLSYCL